MAVAYEWAFLDFLSFFEIDGAAGSVMIGPGITGALSGVVIGVDDGDVVIGGVSEVGAGSRKLKSPGGSTGDSTGGCGAGGEGTGGAVSGIREAGVTTSTGKSCLGLAISTTGTVNDESHFGQVPSLPIAESGTRNVAVQ